MNKLFKRIGLLAASAVLAFTCVACGGGGGDNSNKGNESVDASKTQLTVKYYGAGYGDEWINNYIKAFEEKYKDYKNGDKVGVQVTTDPAMTKYGSVEELRTNANDVYFLEGVDFSTFAKNGAFEDISSIVTTENEDGKTIESKLSETQKSYFSVGGKYYGLPHYTGTYGLVYNKDLFEKHNLYIKDGATVADFFVSSSTDKKSAGPDGKTGVIDGIDYSADDGLPATYDEFFMLLDYMNGNSKTLGIRKPIAFSGKYKDAYTADFMNLLAANYNGVEQHELTLSYEGTATKLVKMTADGKVDLSTGSVQLEEAVVSSANGYELARQAGVYYGATFLEKLLTNGTAKDPTYVPSVSLGGSFTHKQAQKAFLDGDYALLLDGDWWLSEASASISSADKMTRKFGWMPLPHATSEQVGDNQVYADAMRSSAAVRAGLDAATKDLAMKFVQGFYTDSNLVEFTKTTSTLIGVDYKEALNNAKSQLTPYALTLNDFIQTADVSYQITNKDFYNLHYNTLLPTEYFKVGSKAPLSCMIDKDKTMTAKTYFEEFYKQMKAKNIWG